MVNQNCEQLRRGERSSEEPDGANPRMSQALVHYSFSAVAFPQTSPGGLQKKNKKKQKKKRRDIRSSSHGNSSPHQRRIHVSLACLQSAVALVVGSRPLRVLDNAGFCPSK